MNIIGRQHEKKVLDSVWQSPKAELLAVYGRRRVGKTYLLQQYFKNKGLYFELTGLYKATLQQQLQNFTDVYTDSFLQGRDIEPPKSWQAAFKQLRKQLDTIESTERITLFFDEVPWLDSPRSYFLTMLENCWNRYLSQDKRVILILCGSAASWMIKNVINNKGGLHGRISQEIQLLPFSIEETNQYLTAKNINYDPVQLTELYLCLGGIPKYLSLVQRGQSAREAINTLCFTKNGALVNEFNNLYNSLFKNAAPHMDIIRALAKHPEGLVMDVLLKKSGLVSGGTTTGFIEDLTTSGFVARLPNFNYKSKESILKLIDEYSIFYLRWIEPRMQLGQTNFEKNYWLTRSQDRPWSTWAGFAFESVCWKHINLIKQQLGISGVSTIQSAWRGSYDDQVVQIDLLIERQDGCINLCELKFSNTEFVITKSVADSLVRKKMVFQQATKTKKSIIVTMITMHGCKKNDHYIRAVDKEVSW